MMMLFSVWAEKHIYDVVLFGKSIGTTIVEKIDRGNGEVQYKLSSNSEANVLFTKKTSVMNYDILYKNGQLFSAYVKNVKDGVAEVIDILWQQTKYLIKKDNVASELASPVSYSSIHLYFSEPKGKSRIFSERMGTYCTFTNPEPGVYECKMANGVNNIYRYKNGVLYELEMSKGASVYMRLKQ